MKTLFLIFIILFGLGFNLFSQEERKNIREGNKLYNDEQYEKSELKFKKALELNPSEKKVNNNIGASQYRKNSFNDAASSYENIISSSDNNKEKADAYYNIGNSYLQSGKYDKSIESYRNALRLNPEHDLSRYNMAVATKAKLQNQPQSSQDQDQNGDGQQNEEQQQDQQENQQNEEKKDERQQREPKDNEMSQEEMERFLESLQEKEKDVIDKVNKDKFKSSRRNIEKEW
jgi:tetratricopeptide (TPR) repeat protein